MKFLELTKNIDYEKLKKDIPDNESFQHLVGAVSGSLNSIYYHELNSKSQEPRTEEKKKHILKLAKLFVFKNYHDESELQKASLSYQNAWDAELKTGVNNLITSARTMQSINWFVHLAKFEEIDREEFERGWVGDL